MNVSNELACKELLGPDVTLNLLGHYLITKALFGTIAVFIYLLLFHVSYLKMLEIK